MSDNSSTEKPDWWIENEELRESYGLPAYDPPKFEDGAYVHEVVNELEAEFGCSIRILGVATAYLDDWEVRLNDETVFEVGRHRNEYGNTIYEMPSDSFIDKLESTITDN